MTDKKLKPFKWQIGGLTITGLMDEDGNVVDADGRVLSDEEVARRIKTALQQMGVKFETKPVQYPPVQPQNQTQGGGQPQQRLRGVLTIQVGNVIFTLYLVG